MRGKKVVAIAVATVVVLGTAWYAIAQYAKTPYPSMASLDRYLMEDRNSEIALARSAAPESISRDAEVMVLGCHFDETAIKGTNGFVCIVERSWTAPIDDPGFWNPKGRAPLCLAAARSYLPCFVFARGNRDLYAHLSETFGDNASIAELLEAIP